MKRDLFCAALAVPLLWLSAAGQEIDKHCDLSTASFDIGMRELDYGGWKVFVDPKNKENTFEICINGKQLIFGPGILAQSKAVRVDGGDLVLETAVPSQSIPPHDLLRGRIDWNGFKTDHGAVYGIAEHYLYRISLSDLSREAIAQKGKKGISVFMKDAAWARFSIEPLSQEETQMDIFWGADAGAKAAVLVMKGFRTGDAARSPLNDPPDIKKISDFVRSSVDRFKNQVGKVHLPGVSIELKANKDHSEKKKPRFIVSMFPEGSGVGKLPDGDRAFVLLWCSYPNPRNNNKPYGLETLDEHYAHSKTD